MSKPIVVEIPHKLTRAEARERLRTGFVKLQAELGGKVMNVEERWEGDRLNFRAGTLGQTISGRIDVLDSSVRVEVDLPWFLAAIADKVRGRLQKAGTLLLEKK